MIYDINKLDLVGKRRDGGVELYIISSGELDDSPETQELLLDKIEKYLGYIASDEFHKEFETANSGNIWIVLKLSSTPSFRIQELCKKVIPWVEDNGAKFKVIVGGQK